MITYFEKENRQNFSNYCILIIDMMLSINQNIVNTLWIYHAKCQTNRLINLKKKNVVM